MNKIILNKLRQIIICSFVASLLFGPILSYADEKKAVSFDKLTEYFKEVALDIVVDSHDNVNDNTKKIHKWNSEIKVKINSLNELSKAKANFEIFKSIIHKIQLNLDASHNDFPKIKYDNQYSNLDIYLTPKADFDIIIKIFGQAISQSKDVILRNKIESIKNLYIRQYELSIKDNKEEHICFNQVSLDEDNLNIAYAIFFVNEEMPAENIKKCLVFNILRSLGFTKRSEINKNSSLGYLNFPESPFVNVTETDIQLLSLLYNKNIKSGMNEKILDKALNKIERNI